jgi:Metallo-peptidase family M12/Bacterial Ig domain
MKHSKAVIWAETRILALACAGLVTGCLGLIGSPLDSSPPLFLESAIRVAGATGSKDEAVHCSRVAKLNPLALAALAAEPMRARGLYRLNLFAEEPYLVCMDSHEQLATGIDQYLGSVQGQPGGQVVLVRRGELLAGSVNVPGRGLYRITPRGAQLCELAQLEALHLPVCGFTSRPAPNQGQPAAKAAKKVLSASSDGAAQAQDQEREIELMMVYTPGARDAALGTDTIELLANASVSEANAALQSSGTGVRVRLVHIAEVDYEESGDLQVDLDRLRTPGDGFMDEVHAWRDTYQADLVCLIERLSADYEGIAAYPNGPASGFSIVQEPFLTSFGMLAHELGHNFGCDHDRENACGTARFNFSYGHRLQVDDQQYRTLMCYSPGWPISLYSSPEVSFRGVPTGVAAGQAGEADNARTIREMAAFVASYRGIHIELTSPTDGAVFHASDAIQLSAAVLSSEGPVPKVEFLEGTTLLGEAAGPDYTFAWTNAAPGKHRVFAEGTIEGGAPQTSGPVTLTVSPANDDFAQRKVLTGSVVVVRTVLSGATAEPGEPEPFGSPQKTAWWTWSAQAAGTIRLSASGGSVKPLVAVYTGDTLTDLQLVAKTDLNASEIVFQAIPGMSYQIVVGGDQDGTPVSLSLTWQPPPTNDDFAQRQELTGSALVVSAVLSEATAEPGEPEPFGPPQKTAWWTWSAPEAGTVRLSASGGSVQPLVAVYTGDTLTNLQLVAKTDLNKPEIVFQAVPGVSYQIVVGGDQDETPVSLSLTWEPPPDNDNFANAQRVTFDSGSVRGTTRAATHEEGDPVVGPKVFGHSIWFAWVPSSSGLATIVLAQGSAAEDKVPNFGVFRGASLPDLQRVANGGQANEWFKVVANTTYWIEVDGDNEIVTLFFTLVAIPPNDNFAGRTLVNGSTAFLPISIFAATREEAEPSHGSIQGGHSQWWSWRAPTTGAVRIDRVAHSGFSPLSVAFYTGAALTSLVEVASVDFTNAFQEAFFFPVLGGTVYQIAVDGRPISGTPQTLRLDVMAQSPNDDFARRSVISAVPYSTSGTTLWATAEAGEPNHGGQPAQHSLWWTAAFPSSALIAATVDGSGDVLPHLSVYSGSALSNLTLVAENSSSTSVTPTIVFPVEPGQRYQFAVDEPISAYNFVLSIKSVSRPPNDDFAKRASLSSNLALGTTVGATAEPDEPDHTGSGTRHSVWYTWKAAPTGPAGVVASARHPNLVDGSAARAVWPEPAVAVYQGDSLSNLVLIVRGSGAVNFVAERSVSYQIAIDGESNEFAVKVVSSPSNDSFAKASSVFAFDLINVDPLALRLASQEPGEPCHAGQSTGHSLWWTGVASQTGRYTLRSWFDFPSSTSLRVIQAVYTGTALSNLTVLASNAWDNVSFTAAAGTRFYIAVDLPRPQVPVHVLPADRTELTLDLLPTFSASVLNNPDQVDFLVLSRGIGWGLQNLALESSTDLINWEPARTLSVSVPNYRFSAYRTEAPRKFYRLVLLP